MDASTMLFIFLGILVAVFSPSGFDRRWRKARLWDKPNRLGDAGFASDEQCAQGNLLSGRGLWLAFTQTSKRILRYRSDSHVVVVGPTGCGKARDLLLGLVLSLGSKRSQSRPYTLLANDPKGQLLAVCFKERLKVGPVLALNPFGIHVRLTLGVKQVRYNPMASLRADGPILAIQCDKITDGVIFDSGNPGSRFWDDGARELVSGLIMSHVCDGRVDEKNLLAVSDKLCGDLFGYCRDVVSKAQNRYVKARLGPYAAAKAAESRTLQDIVQTARAHTKFIRNEVLGPSLCGSDFTFKELRERPCSLFLVLPLDASSEIYDRYFRLIVASALAEMLSEDCLGKTSVLFLLDEAALLGRLSSLEQAITMARGFGIQFLSVFTDIPTMQRIYHDGFRSFLANSGVRIFFPPADSVTADEISKLCGQTEVVTQSRSVTADRMTNEPVVSDSMSQHARPLLFSHECMNLGSDELLIFANGVKGVIRAKRRPFWKTHPGLFQPDPYEKGKRR